MLHREHLSLHSRMTANLSGTGGVVSATIQSRRPGSRGDDACTRAPSASIARSSAARLTAWRRPDA